MVQFISLSLINLAILSSNNTARTKVVFWDSENSLESHCFERCESLNQKNAMVALESTQNLKRTTLSMLPFQPLVLHYQSQENNDLLVKCG